MIDYNRGWSIFYRLFDNHTHIADREFEDMIEQVLQNAHKVGVTHIIVPSSDLKSSKAAVDFANAHENVFAAIGSHPHEAKFCDKETLQFYENMTPRTERSLQ